MCTYIPIILQWQTVLNWMSETRPRPRHILAYWPLTCFLILSVANSTTLNLWSYGHLSQAVLFLFCFFNLRKLELWFDDDVIVMTKTNGIDYTFRQSHENMLAFIITTITSTAFFWYQFFHQMVNLGPLLQFSVLITWLISIIFSSWRSTHFLILSCQTNL